MPSGGHGAWGYIRAYELQALLCQDEKDKENIIPEPSGKNDSLPKAGAGDEVVKSFSSFACTHDMSRPAATVTLLGGAPPCHL